MESDQVMTLYGLFGLATSRPPLRVRVELDTKHCRMQRQTEFFAAVLEPFPASFRQGWHLLHRAISRALRWTCVALLLRQASGQRSWTKHIAYTGGLVQGMVGGMVGGF